MPWSNQGGGKGGKGGGGGPWGQGGGGGPWGQGGGGGGGGGGGPWGPGGGQQPPDLEEMLKRSQDRMKQVMHGSGVPGPLLFLAGAVGVAVVAWNAFFFRVNPDEVGVVMRFGEYVRQESAGLHFRMPYPVEHVELPKVTVQRTIEIGGQQSGRPGGSTLMLTGDGNVVELRAVVFWRIKTEVDKDTGEPGVKQYLFNIQDPENTVREVGESSIREVVGKSNLQSILTDGRVMGQVETQKLMQQILDSYRAGIVVDQVQFIEVDPPADVIAAFRDVQAAGQDKDRMIKEAQTYADQIVPKAKGEADRITATAQGYRDQTVAEATGQAARFTSVYEEYKKAPEVTRQRLFLEMQEKVLQGADKIIIDGKAGSGVVPFLPLDQLQRSQRPEGGN